jgi:hypothetical protein
MPPRPLTPLTSFAVVCPHCAASVRVPGSLAGQQRPCPRCKRPVVIPAASVAAGVAASAVAVTAEPEPDPEPDVELVSEPAPALQPAPPLNPPLRDPRFDRDKASRFADLRDGDDDHGRHGSRPPDGLNVVRVAAWVFLTVVFFEKLLPLIIGGLYVLVAMGSRR